MTLHYLSILMLMGCACAAPAADDAAEKAAAPQDELKADASSYVRTYSNWGSGYPTNNYVTGYGLLDDKYNNGGYNGYQTGYNGYNTGNNGYNTGYNGYNTGYNGYSGYNGYAGDTGFTGNGYKGYGGYDSGVASGYGQNSIGGNGGYGGYGGNGGINSYYGYNNPQYQGANGQHLGYGYRKPGFGNIYNSGITPSLVTGYRGYSRR